MLIFGFRRESNSGLLNDSPVPGWPPPFTLISHFLLCCLYLHHLTWNMPFFLMKTGWILLYCMRELSTRPQGTEQGTAITAFHWVNRAQFTSWELRFLCGVSMFCVFKFPPKIHNKIQNSKLPEGVNARAKVCLACYPASDILQARIERMSIF